MSTLVLVPGMWLGTWAWQEVTGTLRRAGHEVHPLTLTGVGERVAEATPKVDLDTHTADIVRLVEERDLREVVLVGHSYGGLPVTAAADRIPDRLARVVYVDSGPPPDGTSQADLLEPPERDEMLAGVVDGLVPPRAWDPAADPVALAGLDADALDQLRRRATGHPLGSIEQPLRRTGGHPVPVALIACLFPVEQVRAMVGSGHPFFAGLTGADLYGLPTGHWPMLSEPKRLAELLDEIAG